MYLIRSPYFQFRIYNTNHRKPSNSWKLNSALLNHHSVKEEIKKEIIDFIEFSKNKSRTYPNLWNTMKAVLKVKLIALSNKESGGAGEMAQRLRALPDLLKVLSSIPSNYMVTHNHLK